MAIVFELVINFGLNNKAAQSATNTLGNSVVRLRGVELCMTPPFVTEMHRPEGDPQYIEFVIHPRGIGYGGPGPMPPFGIRDLSNEELSEVGYQLYGLLRGLDGYEAAIVGWDAESLVDIDELESDWLPDGSLYRLAGLVIADEVAERWRVDERFVRFDEDHRWLPYGGSRLAM